MIISLELCVFLFLSEDIFRTALKSVSARDKVSFQVLFTRRQLFTICRRYEVISLLYDIDQFILNSSA